MSREEFKKWLTSISDREIQHSICLCLAEALYEDHNDDTMSMSDIRRHVYEMYPEWH